YSARVFLETLTPRPVAPQPSCKVGELDWHASLRNRHLTQWTRNAPRRGVVNVDIGFETFTHALHQPVTHQVVHATVSTELTRHLALLLPEWRLILVLIFIEWLPAMTSFLSINEDSWWIVAEDPFRALDQVDAIVWTRCADVVLQHDRPPSGCFNDTRVVVTGFVDFFPLRISRRHVVLPIRFKTKMS